MKLPPNEVLAIWAAGAAARSAGVAEFAKGGRPTAARPRRPDRANPRLPARATSPPA